MIRSLTQIETQCQTYSRRKFDLNSPKEVGEVRSNLFLLHQLMLSGNSPLPLPVQLEDVCMLQQCVQQSDGAANLPV